MGSGFFFSFYPAKGWQVTVRTFKRTADAIVIFIFREQDNVLSQSIR